MMKRCIMLFLWLCIVAFSVSAQSNHTLDRILAEQELRFGSALYLVLTARSALVTGSDPGSVEALRSVRTRLRLAAEDAVTLGQYAYILQEFFDLPAGLMYRLVPGPRYAARGLAAADIIPGRAYPGMRLSGRDALAILGRALAHLEGTL